MQIIQGHADKAWPLLTRNLQFDGEETINQILTQQLFQSVIMKKKDEGGARKVYNRKN